MKLFETKTKRNYVHVVFITTMMLISSEVSFLSELNPKTTHEAGFLFLTFAFFGMMVCLYFYGKAKREDKLAEGL